MTHPVYLTVNKKFVQGIKDVENNLIFARKRGEFKDERWYPGKSPEGGLPTLAWGHKLTPREWETKRVFYGDTSKDFRYGLTQDEAHALLCHDLQKAEDLARDDWNKYLGEIPYDSLPDKYKGVLVNLVFNTGPLVKKGKWIWSTVARGIQQKDDTIVARGMVTSYKKPNGERVSLTSRAVVIAKALGLPWQVIK